MTTTIQQLPAYPNEVPLFMRHIPPPPLAFSDLMGKYNGKLFKGLLPQCIEDNTTSDNVNGAFNITKRAKTDLNNDIEFAYLPTSPFGFGKKKVLLSADKQLRRLGRYD